MLSDASAVRTHPVAGMLGGRSDEVNSLQQEQPLIEVREKKARSASPSVTSSPCSASTTWARGQASMPERSGFERSELRLAASVAIAESRIASPEADSGILLF